jgi:uncharacterized protein
MLRRHRPSARHQVRDGDLGSPALAIAAAQVESTFLEQNAQRRYPATMKTLPPALSTEELAERLRGFCERHHIRRLEVFGSIAHGKASPTSDVDLLVTLDDSLPVSTAELLDMAGEAEELVGAPVDFVLRRSLEQSPNRYAREHILRTAVRVYGS